MPDCEEYTNLTVQDGWQHCFTFPREISIKEGKVIQKPIRELQDLRKEEEKTGSILEKKDTKVFEVEVEGIAENQFQAVLANELILSYENGRFEMKFMDQEKSSVSAGRSIRFWKTETLKNVRILADVSSVEVFLNDGEAVFSTRYYPKEYAIKTEAPGAEITFWEL